MNELTLMKWADWWTAFDSVALACPRPWLCLISLRRSATYSGVNISMYMSCSRLIWARKKTKFNYGSIEAISKSIIGVYVIWRPSIQCCIYVGEAKEQPLKNRLLDHWRGSHNNLLNLWLGTGMGREGIEVCYRETTKSQISPLERKLIYTWKPEANKAFNPNIRDRRNTNV